MPDGSDLILRLLGAVTNIKNGIGDAFTSTVEITSILGTPEGREIAVKVLSNAAYGKIVASVVSKLPQDTLNILAEGLQPLFLCPRCRSKKFHLTAHAGLRVECAQCDYEGRITDGSHWILVVGKPGA